MKVFEVNNSQLDKEFMNLPRYLYRQDPNWISPLDKEIRSIFNPDKNPFFQHGECTRFVLKDDSGKAIGRIAAFIDNKKLKADKPKYGGIGFFESVEEKAAAFLLFDAARAWLKARGMANAYGPINFGENDKFWGLLVDGFQPPSYGMNYNPPYYQQYFEDYGFKKSYDQLTNILQVAKPFPERFARISDWLRNKKEYDFRHFSIREKDKFMADFIDIYNDAWKDFENFSPIDLPTIRDAFRQLRPIMDEKLIWFAYHNGQPIAFVLCMPDVNQLLQPFKGKMGWIEKLRFVWLRQFKTVDRIRITVMGCKQKFQNHGIESGLIRCLQEEVVPRNTIQSVELAWVGDFNSKMLALHEATGAEKYKVHRTYEIAL